MQFGYTSDLLDRCPELVAGMIWIGGIKNHETPAEIDDIMTAAEQLTHERFATPPDIAKHESIAAWRQIYSRLGVKPNRYPCAAEGLIRRVVEAGALPRISALVDLCNAASLRYAIPVAPFDLANVVGDCVVGFATGAESFLPINADVAEPIPVGEVVYQDASSEVLSRRWNWRQSDKGKVSLQTTNLLLTTEAVHESARQAVEGVLEELARRIPAFVGGSVTTAILDRQHSVSQQAATNL
jgi:DNA/RNA-binding domain of Phe-tRNA-synthetase-like protein